MLHVPRTLILQYAFLSLLQHLGEQRRHVCFVSELFYRRKERLEIEDDGTAERQASQRLPVDAKVDAGERKVGHLEGTEVFVRIAWGHKDGGVDFKTPGAALDGTMKLEAGEMSVRNVLSARHRLAEIINGERTDPLRIPSLLCSLGSACGSP